ncbi:unnamed protein product [Candida verbasci]|uniref:Sulfite efflux pump SSU1 n=1 Tax=Candida verbasci TaxID=1227364 RepID=A0A9W4TV64_9ASCO|nr:unnamed protein product [Candida verbasci]
MSTTTNKNGNHLDHHQTVASDSNNEKIDTRSQNQDNQDLLLPHNQTDSLPSRIDPAKSTSSSTSTAHHNNNNNYNNNDMDYESIVTPINSKLEFENTDCSSNTTQETTRTTKTTDLSFYHRVVINDWVKNFSLAYFVSVMGCGISSSLLYKFPWPAHWLIICSYIMFAIACILFIINCILFTLSIVYYPDRVAKYLLDPTQATFMGCFSMGFTTLVNYIGILCDGKHMYFVWTLYWIALAGALYSSFIVVFFAFFSKLNKKLEILDAKLNATLLLPIVAITVISSSGHQIELELYKLNETIITMIISFMVWCLSISLAFMIMTIYVYRLIIHKIPPTHLIFTSFLPVGFLGQSSYSIYLFGNNLNKLIPEELLWGKILLCIAGFFSFFLLSLGYFMVFVAVVSLLSKIKPFAKKNINLNHTNKFGLLKHNKNFWAMTFPLGTMSLSNTEIGLGGIGGYKLLTFKVMGAIFATCCILITTGCLIGVVIYNLKRIRLAFMKRKQSSMV